jgi:heme O synthase-like polyprenyltransferase
MWVFVFVLFFIYIFFYDEIVKIKEEFNILIGSRSRIINLHVSCISNIR